MSGVPIGIVRFPGTNCDQDVFDAVAAIDGARPVWLWHKETELGGVRGIVLAGGFAYGDYLRAGAIARFSPIMERVIAFARSGGPVLGICNGFQILTEAGLLPGALMRNAGLCFVCREQWLRVDGTDTPFTRHFRRGAARPLPGRPRRGQLRRRRRDARPPGGRGAGRLPLRRRERRSDSAGEPQRLGAEHRRHRGRARQRRRAHAPSRSRDEPAGRLRGRTRRLPRAPGGRGVTVALRDTPVTPDVVAAHGLRTDEYDRIVELLGREPNFTELGVFSLMWSEHCGYKYSRALLSEFPSTGPQVVQGPGENAGAVDVGHGFAVVFKMESHNHPSAVEPYQGAATGVGRDPPRRVHDGRAPDRHARQPAVRRARRSPRPLSLPPRRAGRRRLRELRRRSDRRRRDRLRRRLRRQSPRQRDVRGAHPERGSHAARAPPGPATPSTCSAPRPAATGSTARASSRPPSSPPTPPRAAPPSRSATRSPRSSCWKRRSS